MSSLQLNSFLSSFNPDRNSKTREAKALKKGENKNNIEVAKLLLKEDASLALITKSTGLSLEEVEEIVKAAKPGTLNENRRVKVVKLK